MDKRLAVLEGELEERAEGMRVKAREKGRRLAQAAARRIDPIFTPRRLNPDDAKVLFHPIDYVVFKGMNKGGQITSLILLDRQGETREQRRLQESIQETVERGRVDWETLRVANDGGITRE
jgi:predicted Holliday junction resolvase-like endonuclease